MKRLFLRSLWMCGATLLAAAAVVPARAESPTQATPANTADAIATLQSDQPLFERAMACRSLAIAGDASAVDALAAVLDSHELAAYARHALEEIADPAATEALVAAIDRVSPDVRVGILTSLGRRGDKRAVPSLAQYLDAAEPEVVDAALSGLAQIASDDAITALVRHVPSATRPSSLAAAILLAAERRGVGHEDVLAIRALRHVDALVNDAANIDRSGDIRRNLHRFADAASAQLVLRHVDDAAPRLAALLASDREDAFQLGVQAARQADAFGVAALLKAFPTASPRRKIALTSALSDSKAPEAFAVVLAAADSDDADLRRFALEALGNWPNPAGIERLLESLGDSDAEIVATASAALATLDAAAVDEAIVARLNTTDTSTLVAAAGLAGSRGITSAEERLFALSQHADDAVARAAVLALGSVVSQDRYPDLLDLLAQPTLDRKETQAALTQAAQRLSRDACVPSLAHALDNADTATRQAVLEVLGTLEGDAALHLIAEAAASDDEAVVDTATRLLGRWSSPAAADALVDLAERLKNETFQTRAVRGLLRIVRQFDLPLERRIDLAMAAAAVARRPEEQALVTEILLRYPDPRGLTAAMALVGVDSPDAIDARVLPIAAALTSRGDAATVVAIAQLKDAVHGTPLEPRVNALLEEAQRQVATAASEEGFVPLFDGSSLSGWAGSRSVWRAEGGTIVGGSVNEVVGTGNDFLCTEKTYGNFELRLQFRLQGEGANGGVNVRSLRRDDGVAAGYQADLGHGYFGGLFDEARRNRFLATPQLHPTLTADWNDYRIRCEGPRIRIWLNGTLTADFVETDDVSDRGIIALQVQAGRKVEASYRKIRLRELTGAEIEPAAAEEPPAEEAFTPLFDGRTFAGWHGNLEWFRIENEAIIAGSLEKPIPRNEFLRTDAPYGDFELRLQFQLRGGAAANAGVQIRTAEIPDHHEVSGYQADMGDGWWGCLYDESRRNRVLAGPAPQDRGTMLRENDWNDYRIRCEGDRVRLWINDVLTVDYTENDPAIARTGIIAVQVHSGPPTEAWYRRLRLMELK